MQFLWDERKNESNIVKHNMDFADAFRLFAGPMRIIRDNRHEYGEDRFIGLGLLDNQIVVAAFTEPEEDVTRIISMRRALAHEQKQYEHYLKQLFGN